jgi:hypothetical protein
MSAIREYQTIREKILAALAKVPETWVTAPQIAIIAEIDYRATVNKLRRMRKEQEVHFTQYAVGRAYKHKRVSEYPDARN